MIDGEDPTTTRGPFLTMAAFFEVVIREENNVLTLVRMIDRITIETESSWSPGLPPVPISARLVVAFRGENLAGSGVVSVQPRKPSGETLERMDIPFVYEGQTGLNLNIEMRLPIDEEGYYWFDIFLNDRHITMTPLQIVFQSTTDSEGERPAIHSD
jgi:hypothetical protein